ncbi:MAG: aconitase X catalytic domain-containing protein [Sphingobacterium sp.]|nr:aconitase X catalytic domain-containing protein [Sphingobacterium sp.]
MGIAPTCTCTPYLIGNLSRVRASTSPGPSRARWPSPTPCSGCARPGPRGRAVRARRRADRAHAALRPAPRRATAPPRSRWSSRLRSARPRPGAPSGGCSARPRAGGCPRSPRRRAIGERRRDARPSGPRS